MPVCGQSMLGLALLAGGLQIFSSLFPGILQINWNLRILASLFGGRPSPLEIRVLLKFGFEMKKEESSGVLSQIDCLFLRYLRSLQKLTFIGDVLNFLSFQIFKCGVLKELDHPKSKAPQEIII